MEAIIPIIIGIIGLIFKNAADKKKAREASGTKKPQVKQQVEKDVKQAEAFVQPTRAMAESQEARTDYYNKKKSAEMAVGKSPDIAVEEEVSNVEPFGLGLTDKELVRSIVLGEVLGPPKSKKPYGR